MGAGGCQPLANVSFPMNVSFPIGKLTFILALFYVINIIKTFI